MIWEKFHLKEQKIISQNKRWEKLSLKIDSEIIGDFPTNFGISFTQLEKYFYWEEKNCPLIIHIFMSLEIILLY